MFAAAGSREASTASRSCTTCRAAIRSVPSLRIRTTDESPSTDFDRIVLSPIVPLSEFSSGTLIRLSTSSVDSPGASVWISIKGGANSGNTSRGAFRARWMPTIISTIDSASTITRIRNDVETIQFIMGRFAPGFQFSVFSCSVGHQRGRLADRRVVCESSGRYLRDDRYRDADPTIQLTLKTEN